MKNSNNNSGLNNYVINNTFLIFNSQCLKILIYKSIVSGRRFPKKDLSDGANLVAVA